jgi:ATP adenylyltransferase/5',5'''-P-1,P-4-tetraphosphate phosphorylase II
MSEITKILSGIFSVNANNTRPLGAVENKEIENHVNSILSAVEADIGVDEEEYDKSIDILFDIVQEMIKARTDGDHKLMMELFKVSERVEKDIGSRWLSD